MNAHPITRPRILSGMRPTGPLHIGHLFGALENWRQLQNDSDCYYMVADWHALMSEYKDPSRIRQYTRENVADWIACGIDPERSTIFVQSDVPEHAELHLILSTVTPVAWLERCPTYKEQLQELAAKEINNYAFLGYPLLQTCDILLYKAHLVPVGEDQLPHLELAREICRRFNSLYGAVFPEPQAKLTSTPRILGIDNRKMSKSYGNFIALSDEPDEIRRKVWGMFTDPQRIRRTDPGRPEICNVHAYWQLFDPQRAEQVAEQCRKAEIGCTDNKRELAEVIVARMEPIRRKRSEILADPAALDRLLARGAERARAFAARTMHDVRRAIAFEE